MTENRIKALKNIISMDYGTKYMTLSNNKEIGENLVEDLKMRSRLSVAESLDGGSPKAKQMQVLDLEKIYQVDVIVKIDSLLVLTGIGSFWLLICFRQGPFIISFKAYFGFS
jgi:hypothetical protein